MAGRLEYLTDAAAAGSLPQVGTDGAAIGRIDTRRPGSTHLLHSFGIEYIENDETGGAGCVVLHGVSERVTA